jgi:hypothetical protein
MRSPAVARFVVGLVQIRAVIPTPGSTRRTKRGESARGAKSVERSQVRLSCLQKVRAVMYQGRRGETMREPPYGKEFGRGEQCCSPESLFDSHALTHDNFPAVHVHPAGECEFPGFSRGERHDHILVERQRAVDPVIREYHLGRAGGLDRPAKGDLRGDVPLQRDAAGLVALPRYLYAERLRFRLHLLAPLPLRGRHAQPSDDGDDGREQQCLFHKPDQIATNFTPRQRRKYARDMP